MRRLRIAIDMDEVLADTLTKHLAIYNLEHGDSLTKRDLEGKKIYDAVRAERREQVREYPRAKDFFRDIPVMPGSRDVLDRLLDRYEVFITTAAMEFPTSFVAKYEWIKEHFPFFPDSHIVFCGDKSIIAADFLIDDNARHFERFSGEGLLFTAPHNLFETRYPRLNNWQDVRERFLENVPNQ
jgi:5'(3')-deoxyribonucleotidase